MSVSASCNLGDEMNAENLERYEVLLMINQETGVLYPLSAHALHFAQGSLNSVKSRIQNELVLGSEGSIRRITGFRPINDDIAARLRRLVGLAYAIEVELAPVSIELDRFKSLLLRGLRDYTSNLEGDDSWAFVLQPFAEIEAKRSRGNQQPSFCQAPEILFACG